MWASEVWAASPQLVKAATAGLSVEWVLAVAISFIGTLVGVVVWFIRFLVRKLEELLKGLKEENTKLGDRIDAKVGPQTCQLSQAACQAKIEGKLDEAIRLSRATREDIKDMKVKQAAVDQRLATGAERMDQQQRQIDELKSGVVVTLEQKGGVSHG